MSRKRKTSVSGRFHAILKKLYLSFIHVPKGDITSQNPVVIIVNKQLMVKYWIYRETQPVTIVIIEARPLTVQMIDKTCSAFVSTLVEQETFGIMVDRCGNTSILDAACIQEACPIIDGSNLTCISKELYEDLSKYYEYDFSKLGLYLLALPDGEKFPEDDKEEEEPIENVVEEIEESEPEPEMAEPKEVRDSIQESREIFQKNIRTFFKEYNPAIRVNLFESMSLPVEKTNNPIILVASGKNQESMSLIVSDTQQYQQFSPSKFQSEIYFSIENVGEVGDFVDLFMEWHMYLAENFSGICYYLIDKVYMSNYDGQVLPPLFRKICAERNYQMSTSMMQNCYSCVYRAPNNNIFTEDLGGEE